MEIMAGLSVLRWGFARRPDHRLRTLVQYMTRSLPVKQADAAGVPMIAESPFGSCRMCA
jgi:hypothetical protein